MGTYRFSAELAADFQAIFNLLPGANLLLSPYLQVELVSAGYQAAVAAGWPSLPVGAYAPALLEAAPAGHCLAARLRASLRQVLLTGQPHEAACRRSCQLPSQEPAGAPATWQLTSQPLHDAAGALSHVLCHLSLHPVLPVPVPPAAPPTPAPTGETGRAAVLAHLPVALCLLQGPGYVVEEFNLLASRVWSLSAAQAIGRPFLELLPATAVADYATACNEARQTGQPVSWPEMPVLGFAAPECLTMGMAYFSLCFQALPPLHRGDSSLLLIAQNITPLLQARQQVQQLQAELAATVAGLADYVAELLRAPAAPPA